MACEDGVRSAEAIRQQVSEEIEAGEKTVHLFTERELPAEKVEEWIDANAVPGDGITIFDEDGALERDFTYE